MTIAVAGNFSEGIVLGVDSAVSYLNSNEDVIDVYEAAQKIYHIGRKPDHSDSPFAAMVFGAAEFAGLSWRNVFADFWRLLKNKDPDKMQDFVNDLLKFLASLTPKESKRPAAGLFLAGYGSKDHTPRCFKIDVKALSFVEIQPRRLHWDGMLRVLENLLNGIDQETVKALNKQYHSILIEVQAGSKKKKVSLVENVIETIQKNAYTCGADMGMPLRDAIDFVHFLVYSTIKHYKFTPGAPVCGGQVEIAVITLDRGFRRIVTKSLSSEL